MVQQKIITDANSYLRLAKSIHPFLSIEIGDKKYCLYVTDAVAKELSNSSKVISKFSWVTDDEFAANRNQRPKISRKQQKEIEDVTAFLFDYVIRNKSGMGLSRVDCNCIAYCSVMNYPLVTDDGPMRELSDEFEFDIQFYTTLELLKIMFDCAHITREKLHQIIQYLHYIDDLPGGLKKFLCSFSAIFGYSLTEHLVFDG